MLILFNSLHWVSLAELILCVRKVSVRKVSLIKDLDKAKRNEQEKCPLPDIATK